MPERFNRDGSDACQCMGKKSSLSNGKGCKAIAYHSLAAANS